MRLLHTVASVLGLALALLGGTAYADARYEASYEAHSYTLVDVADKAICTTRTDTQVLAELNARIPAGTALTLHEGFRAQSQGFAQVGAPAGQEVLPARRQAA